MRRAWWPRAWWPRAWWPVALLACGDGDVSFTVAADASLTGGVLGTYASGDLRITICEGDAVDACTSGTLEGCDAPCHRITGAGADETLATGTGCMCSNPRADLAVRVDAAGTPMRGALSTAPVPGDGYAGPLALRVHVDGAAAPALTGEVRPGQLLLRLQRTDPNGSTTVPPDGGLATWPAPNDRSLAFTKVAGPEACR